MTIKQLPNGIEGQYYTDGKNIWVYNNHAWHVLTETVIITKPDLELWLLRLKTEPDKWTVDQALQSLFRSPA